ncbi:MAG: DUF3151 domain-containing protein [Actinobacteria bacterium]|nr:DUF3151 domain-containing protein [Actinomycetota bacterium]MBV8960971.1 DUF3151 domain-containing protein [Actinomycetota bacterium]MBV9663062.1 DUF3151 domain-containing protein [Actinomycetota bacterium]MBV9934284.1 DUF3151 domain-containing protein [Actinomycetota bacterium]
MTDVPLGSRPPETELPAPPSGAFDLLASDPERAAATYPKLCDAWAALGERAEGQGQTITAYAYFRVGYHRGLDQLRAAGWRGSGYVRWRAPTNQGFLRSLDGLRRMAAAIGEDDEAQRCDQFLHQLDPDWDRR